jgi:mRNA interferase RelE/StbE
VAYHVEVVKQAVKEYADIPSSDKDSVKKAILGLENHPRGPQVKKLQGRDYYRLRVGDWRVFFAVSDKLKKVTVLSIERRTTTTY